nr:autophagy-related protein 11-like [Tanacetum cinerariifolium]
LSFRKGLSLMSQDVEQSSESGTNSYSEYSNDFVDALELVKIAGSSRLEVENAKLKAKLASSLALLCPFSPEIEFDDSEEKRIKELKQKLSDLYSARNKVGDSKSEIVTGACSEPIDEASYGSSSLLLKSGVYGTYASVRVRGRGSRGGRGAFGGRGEGSENIGESSITRMSQRGRGRGQRGRGGGERGRGRGERGRGRSQRGRCRGPYLKDQLGRKMTCTNCQETCHNKSSCKKERVPKPPKVPRPPAPRTVYGTYASVRVRGRGSRGGRGAFEGRGEGSKNIGESSTTRMSQRGRGRGRGQRGRGGGERGRGRGERGRGRSQKGRCRGPYLKDQEEMAEDEIRKNLEHDYMEELLLQEEQKLLAYETEQDEFDQEALRLTLEEEAMYKRMDEERLKKQMAKEERDRKMDYYHPSNWTQEEESFDHEPYIRNVNTLDANVQTQESVAANMSNRGDYEAKELGKQLVEPIVAVTPSAEPIASATHSTNKWKQLAKPHGKKKGSKRKAPASSEEAAGNQRIVFHKHSGRSEKIFNQKMKKSGFGPNREGSTPDKSFSLT